MALSASADTSVAFLEATRLLSASLLAVINVVFLAVRSARDGTGVTKFGFPVILAIIVSANVIRSETDIRKRPNFIFILYPPEPPSPEPSPLEGEGRVRGVIYPHTNALVCGFTISY